MMEYFEGRIFYDKSCRKIKDTTNTFASGIL